ncbi:MAG: adenosylcobinamide amidohydrolase [Dactylosporangium sp.]|nr:adenosylcobinamide amidohydrolase [Dactylosporangium sp.]NNJ63247.1 adenosylcobinamide amidohydrolase [Dactylosporangium sp.]
MLPELICPTDDGRGLPGQPVPLLLWRLPDPLCAISSAPAGGGIGLRTWVMNATVPMTYANTDPEAHLGELAARRGLAGAGVGMLTGVDVADRVVASDGGVVVTATVGIGTPTWAADDCGVGVAGGIGTINVVVVVPVRLTEAALVNVVSTVAEAKAQALWSLGVEGTGTATDAVCVLCPPAGRSECFGGPRSRWGSRVARAVHAALLDGGGRWLASGVAWSCKTFLT